MSMLNFFVGATFLIGALGLGFVYAAGMSVTKNDIDEYPFLPFVVVCCGIMGFISMSIFLILAFFK